MFKSDLVATRDNACSIWIDLTEFPLPGQKDRDDVGLSDEQLAFARTPILQDEYPNTVTALYYLYCSIRVRNYIPLTFAKVLSARHDYLLLDPAHEEEFELPHIPERDGKDYKTLRPDAVVVSYPITANGERITVHRNLTANLSMVQYRYYRHETSFLILKRLAALCKHHESAVLVTNASIRTMLRIKS